MWRTTPQSLIHPFHSRWFSHTHSFPPWCFSHGLEGIRRFYFVPHQLPEGLYQVRLEPPALGFLPLTVPVKGEGLQELRRYSETDRDIFRTAWDIPLYLWAWRDPQQQKLSSSSPENVLQPLNKGYNAVVSGPSTTDSFLCRAPHCLLLALTGAYKCSLERKRYTTDEQNKQNHRITALIFNSSMESCLYFLMHFYSGFCSPSFSTFITTLLLYCFEP